MALDPRTTRQLREIFQGKVCVVSGTSDGVDWHHLDEDEANNSAGNIVPVARDFNQSLEQYRRAVVTEPFLPVEEPLLTPSSLLARARHWFRQGQAGRAYGASRLATWLPFQYPPLFPADDLAVSSLCVCLSAIRHAGHLGLLDDVLARDATWVVARPLSWDQRARILVELGAIHQDVMLRGVGDPKRAAELFEAADRALRRCSRPPLELEAKVLRRRAISQVFSDAGRGEVERTLGAADELELESGQWVGMENARAWLDLAYGRPRKTLDRLLAIRPRMFDRDGLPRSIVAAPWDAFEAVMATAAARLAVDGPKRARSPIAHLIALENEPSLSHLRLRPLGAQLAVTVDGEVDPQMAAAGHRLSARTSPSDASRALVESLARGLAP